MKVVVTSGPTWEAIDPVRFIANRSSGKQGAEIARAFAEHGAKSRVHHGSGRGGTAGGYSGRRVESARDMLDAVKLELPADVGIFAAAVADWRVANASPSKIKKKSGRTGQQLTLVENPDILATVAGLENRPGLVVGFAAETENLEENATAKRVRKGCDWIVANEVGEGTDTFGGDENTVLLVTGDGVDRWPRMPKSAVADRLVAEICDKLRQ